MKPEQERYILDHLDHKSPAAIAKDLGLKERKIKRFLERQQVKEKMTTSSAETKVSRGKGKIFLSIILIVVLGFAVYGNSVGGEFIWDDTHLVEDNLYLRSWSNCSTASWCRRASRTTSLRVRPARLLI